jgi:uncharacterized repeat protein (TIGR01451 family)
MNNYRPNTNKFNMLLTQKQTTHSLLLAKIFAGIFVMICSSYVLAQSGGHISATNSSASTNNSAQSVPNSSVTLDFSINTAESWDTQNDASNVIEHCIDGTSITGFEFSNVTMQSIAGSFFSETVFYFSDSNQGEDTGIKFKMGAGNDTSGTAVFNSNGIFDITDSGIPEDIYSLTDRKFFLQIFEDIDDKPNVIDTNITNGTMTIWGVDLIAVEGCPFIDNSTSTTSDLALTYTTQETGAEIGSFIDITVVVSNEGNSVASNVVMQNILSDNLDFINMSCSDGSSTDDRTSLPNFSLQNVAAQSGFECLLKTEINNTGNININISISTTDPEINLNNNSLNIVFGPAGVTVPINNWLVLLSMGFLIILSIRNQQIH